MSTSLFRRGAVAATDVVASAAFSGCVTTTVSGQQPELRVVRCARSSRSRCTTRLTWPTATG